MFNNLRLYVVAAVYKTGDYYCLKFFVANERIQEKALKVVRDHIEPRFTLIDMLPYGKLDVNDATEKLLSYLRVDKYFDSFVFDQYICCTVGKEEVLLQKMEKFKVHWKLRLDRPLK